MALEWYQLHSIPGKAWCKQHSCSPGYPCAWGSSLVLDSVFLLSSPFLLAQLLWSQRMAVHDGPVGWSPSHGSPSSCPASLTSGRDFWDCFLTWPGVQWELFNLNENAETFRSQKKEKMPWGTRCGSWWFSLGFYQRTGLPCLATQVPAMWHGLMAEFTCPTWPSISSELLLPVAWKGDSGKSSRRQAVLSLSI